MGIIECPPKRESYRDTINESFERISHHFEVKMSAQSKHVVK